MELSEGRETQSMPVLESECTYKSLTMYCLQSESSPSSLWQSALWKCKILLCFGRVHQVGRKAQKRL